MSRYLPTPEERAALGDGLLIEVIQGVEGPSLYVNGLRVAGQKPWAGGTVVLTWKASRKDLREAVREQARRERERRMPRKKGT